MREDELVQIPALSGDEVSRLEVDLLTSTANCFKNYRVRDYDFPEHQVIAISMAGTVLRMYFNDRKKELDERMAHKQGVAVADLLEQNDYQKLRESYELIILRIKILGGGLKGTLGLFRIESEFGFKDPLFIAKEPISRSALFQCSLRFSDGYWREEWIRMTADDPPNITEYMYEWSRDGRPLSHLVQISPSV